MSVFPLVLNAPPLLELDAPDERQAIHGTIGLLRGCADVPDLAGLEAAVLERQRINPPVLGSGVALPHARTPLVRDLVFVAARLGAEVSFGDDRVPVRLVFLFGVPPHRISQYLAATAALVRRLRAPDVIDGLLSAATADEFTSWLVP